LLLLVVLENECVERVQISEQPLMQFGEDFNRIKVKRFVYTPFIAEDAVDEAASSRMHLLSSQERKTEDETLFASLLAKARAHKHDGAAAPGLGRKTTRSGAAATEEARRALSINDTHTQEEVRSPRAHLPGWRVADGAMQQVWARMCEMEIESSGVADGACFQWTTCPAAAEAREGAMRGNSSLTGEVLVANMSTEYDPVTVMPQPRTRALYALPKTSTGVQTQAEGKRACAMHVRQQHEMATLHRLANSDRSYVALVCHLC